VGETAHHLLHAFTYAPGAFHEFDQALLAELFPAWLVLLDGAVGEKQHPVTAPQDLLADLRRRPTETDRQGCRLPAAGQRGGHGSAARGVTGATHCRWPGARCPGASLRS
jgi:hypothetical protein